MGFEGTIIKYNLHKRVAIIEIDFAGNKSKIQLGIEIIEEKISIAERNGDDKAKIELIRLRQKIQREYRRITKLPYEGSRSQNRLGVE